MYRVPPDGDDDATQRSQSSARRRRAEDYYNDEHPNVPRVRRASLYLEPQSRLTSSTSMRMRAVQVEDEYEDEPEQSLPRTSHKIMVAPRRRPVIYEPPPLTYKHTRVRRKYRRSRLSLLLQEHRQMTIVVITAVLALLVLVPLLASRANSDTSVTLWPASGSTPAVGSGSADTQHTLVITPPNTDHPAPPVFAEAAYLLDADTGATLYAYHPFEHLPMLSTTKLMTALLAAEHGNPDQNIVITDQMANDISQLSADSALMHVKKGEVYTLRELLYGLLLLSGNDAAIVIADDIGGNLTNFVAQMNQRAAQLGLRDTHYRNPHGLLTDGHFSSAHDLALLGKASLGMPLIHQISNQKGYHIPQTSQHAEHFLSNGNQFLWWYPGTDAGKTGWDAATDFIQVVSCVRNNHHLIGVTMHTNDWWTDMRDLMNWGFSTYDWISPRDVNARTPVPFAADWNNFVRDKRENTIPTADHGRYYIYTGYSISGLILDYFDKNTGLKKFGFPTSAPTPSNKTMLAQRFEHATIQCDLGSKQCKTL
ncbi:MAG TPA: serine hydrolase [Ktedonobacteraceae bacterium]|nr:serine hydrolase [Ktedonobacteraceae bacterium]